MQIKKVRITLSCKKVIEALAERTVEVPANAADDQLEALASRIQDDIQDEEYQWDSADELDITNKKLEIAPADQKTPTSERWKLSEENDRYENNNLGRQNKIARTIRQDMDAGDN